MAKGAKNRKKENVNHKKRNRNGFTDLEEMDDEIDACNTSYQLFSLSSSWLRALQVISCHVDFHESVIAVHKGRDVIPLDIDGDIGDFDEDNEQPVFDFEV